MSASVPYYVCNVDLREACMVKRVIVGIILTLALLAVARRLSTNRPREIVVERGGRTIVHRTVFEQVGPGEPVVILEIEPAEGAGAFLLHATSEDGDPAESPMVRNDGGIWEGRLPERRKGEWVHYAFRAALPGDDSVRIPIEPDSFFLLKYKGKITPVVLLLHVILMFGAFFFMVQSFWGALALFRGGGSKSSAVRFVRGVMITTFVGGWPIGFILNRQRFGPVWEGFPFGYDVTDNKTQIIFLFWVVTVLLVRGSFFGAGEARDTVGPRGFAWAVIASFIVSLALYMIPHSL
jgi:hypothetical protein